MFFNFKDINTFFFGVQEVSRLELLLGQNGGLMQSKIYKYFPVWIFKTHILSEKKKNTGMVQNLCTSHMLSFKQVHGEGRLTCVDIHFVIHISGFFFVHFLNIHKSHSPPRLIPCSSPHDLHTVHRYHWSQSHFQY